MVATLIRIRDVSRLIAPLEPRPLVNAAKILFVATVEERTDITCFAELETGEGNGRRGRLHDVLAPYAGAE
jgi:hypothetical protein